MSEELTVLNFEDAQSFRKAAWQYAKENNEAFVDYAMKNFRDLFERKIGEIVVDWFIQRHMIDSN
ncbi:hypothetical protein TVAGG3_0202130 [Trichomonas vaginalis G3]|uniref:hypothetical protein n=1 Tax=Trichomonas vaginalis (strain ATCC PRA-98 / G3) TaxID=412133 RepID=UPI0021E5BD39|nr:hypothetical protein TVAGG3_0145080 [Trichomonas vaginalis G3]XP_051111305.1 hypothetical protein TVAGG3_0202130 [Trichomonas vaginalis G3]KAI5546861.1 hypothetical protein TVAGG3_0145080 [Trichomonas vaginalis G3]KAI5550666.1 hypothetical protein TVAGG3_0202130 [Trichomonas vaginalis G3]